MSIVDLGALGEFVGAIAVVATLIYLTIQVRQSKEAMKENARLARAAVCKQTFEIFAEHRRHIIENADVARIWREGLAGRDLDENDRTRFEQVGEEYIFGMNVAFNLGRAAGYERVLEGMPHTLALTMHKGPGMRVIWKRVRGALTTVGDSSFADAVDTAFEALSAQPRKTQR